VGDAVSLLAGLLLTGCAGGGLAPADRPDVVLVTLDTMRADRLGSYGYPLARTETLDHLAARGRRFDRAYAVVPLTMPSHASIFTGTYPAHHGVRDNDGTVLGDEVDTLAEVLHAHGYATAASVAAYVTQRRWGFAQGFDAYFDELHVHGDDWHASRDGKAVVDDAIRWLERTGGKRFLWVHLYDAHFPYAAASRPYDAALAYVDDQVERLVAATAGRPTLFVVVGDHGEGLGDHDEMTHGLFTYDATQRVPFFLSGPGIRAGEVVDQPVSQVDVLPTVLAALALPIPDGIDGRAAPGEPRPLYMEAWSLRERFGLAPHVAVVDGPDKLVAVPRPELYDVVADPGEEHDRSGEPASAARIAELRDTLDGFGFSPPAPPDLSTLDPEVAAQLAQLGYVEGGFVANANGPAVDPKDRRDLLTRSQRADLLDFEGRWAEAEPMYAALLAEYPSVNEFRHRRAMDLVRLGREEEALVVLDDALARDPRNPVVVSAVAHVLARMGRFAEAADLYERAMIEAPHNARLRCSAVAARISDDRASGIARGEAWLAEHPDDACLAGVIGVEHARGGDLVQAVPFLERGMSAEPERDVAFFLSAVARNDGDADRAIDLLRTELRWYPRNEPALRALVVALTAQADWSGVVQVAAAAIERGVEDEAIWHAWAQALFNLKRFPESREVLDRGLAAYPLAPSLMLLDANLLKKAGEDEAAHARFAEAEAALARERAAPRALPSAHNGE